MQSSLVLRLFVMFSMLCPGTPLAAAELEEVAETPLELAAYVLGGIGIFLIGIHFAGNHLKKLSGGRFQQLINHLSGNVAGIAASGAALGFITQSGKAAAFILSDFVQAGMMRVHQVAPIVFWANAGCSLIVFASIVSLKVFALFVLGVTALGITFQVPKKLSDGYGALFGLAMIMYGLYLVKAGAAGYAAAEWVGPVLQNIQDHYLIAFGLGLVLTLLIQSNLAIIMIVIALAGAQLFELEETAMAMFGAQAGTGILTYIFSFHAHGRARQVVAMQIAFDAVATVVFVTLFYIETVAGMPLVLAGARALSSDVGSQAVAVALVFQFGSALLLVVLRNAVIERVQNWFPPNAAEVLSKAKYMHERAAESPETGLILIEKEQYRLLQRLPKYIDYVRNPSPTPGKYDPNAYHEAFVDIAGSIGKTLSRISSHSLDLRSSDQLIRVTKLQEQLVAIESIVHHLSTRLLQRHDDSRASELGGNIMESLDFMVQAVIDALKTQDSGEINMLQMLTQDRSSMMTKIRHNYFESESDLSADDRNFVLDITILFENAVHTLGRYGKLLRTD